ncbi:alpha/beta fold hydrolase [Corallibacter sp.]|uniref:alpha/beta fold hydrolase n=1 Tax=Corallibacter sp. TaxID=2038084 RepID=UPI003AB45B22
MTIFRYVIILSMLLLLCNCNNIPEAYYAEPEYIKSPSPKEAAYFKAYDDALSLWNTDVYGIYVPTTYGTAHVIVSGPSRGEPAVLLHGMDASSTSWYPNVNAISEDYRIYAIDLLIEPGKSKMTKEPESVDDLINWYHEIFEKLKLKEVYLIGASRGGWIATNIALKKKIKVKKMALLSPAQTFMWIPPSQDLIKNIVYALSSDEKRMRQVLNTMSKNVDNIDEAYLKQYYLGTQVDENNKFVASMMPYSKKELSALDMPVLVLVGDDDMINTPKSIDIAKESIKDAEGEVISQAGHFLSIDQAEIVNQIIIEFLNKNN